MRSLSMNPKSETRNPKTERRPKSESRIDAALCREPLRISGLGLLSEFELRISDFKSRGSTRQSFRGIFFAILFGAVVLVNAALAQTRAPVSITESATDFTLANGVVTARVLKRNGDLASLKF